MASRKSNDNTSSTGVSFPGGSQSLTVKGVNYSQFVDQNRALTRSGGFSGNAVEVYADGAVWDIVAGAYLFPGRDFNPSDINRR